MGRVAPNEKKNEQNSGVHGVMTSISCVASRVSEPEPEPGAGAPEQRILFGAGAGAGAG